MNSHKLLEKIWQRDLKKSLAKVVQKFHMLSYKGDGLWIQNFIATKAIESRLKAQALVHKMDI